MHCSHLQCSTDSFDNLVQSTFVSSVKTSVGTRIFSVAGPTRCSSLPIIVKSAGNIVRLAHMFNLVYPSPHSSSTYDPIVLDWNYRTDKKLSDTFVLLRFWACVSRGFQPNIIVLLHCILWDGTDSSNATMSPHLKPTSVGHLLGVWHAYWHEEYHVLRTKEHPNYVKEDIFLEAKLMTLLNRLNLVRIRFKCGCLMQFSKEYFKLNVLINCRML